MNKHEGSTLDSLLDEEGIGEEVDRRARRLLEAKEQVASAVSEGMRARRISKNVLAKKMGTSRSVVYRLLDPTDTSVTLDTIVRAETALDAKFFFAKRRAPRRKVRGK